MTDLEIVAWSNLFTGLLIAVVSWPLKKGKIGPNPIYGARFKLSFKSEDHWYAINTYTGKMMMIWSVPIVTSGIMALFMPEHLTKHAVVLYGCFPFCVLIPAFKVWVFAKKFDAEWEKNQQQ